MVGFLQKRAVGAGGTQDNPNLVVPKGAQRAACGAQGRSKALNEVVGAFEPLHHQRRVIRDGDSLTLEDGTIDRGQQRHGTPDQSQVIPAVRVAPREHAERRLLRRVAGQATEIDPVPRVAAPHAPRQEPDPQHGVRNRAMGQARRALLGAVRQLRTEQRLQVHRHWILAVRDQVLAMKVAAAQGVEHREVDSLAPIEVCELAGSGARPVIHELTPPCAAPGPTREHFANRDAGRAHSASRSTRRSADRAPATWACTPRDDRS